MSFSYRGYELNSYLEFPNYNREIALFEDILGKLPEKTKTFVVGEHTHGLLTDSTSTVVLSVDNINHKLTMPLETTAGFLQLDSNLQMFCSPFAGSIWASDVLYNHVDHPDMSNVQQALDWLLYTTLSYTLSLNPAIMYKGQTCTDLTATWTHNNYLTSQSITTIGAYGGVLSVGALSQIYTGIALTADQVVTVTGTDAHPTTASDTEYLRFELPKYWGQSASATPNETIIEAALSGGTTLSVDAASSRAKASFTQAGGSNYIYYAYPSSWGTATLSVNGFLTIWNLTTVSVSNGYGNTENYNCYTSPTSIVGTVTMVIS